MVVDYFKRTNSVQKYMSHCTTDPQWDIRIVTWLNPMEVYGEGSRSVASDLCHGGWGWGWCGPLGCHRNVVGKVVDKKEN